MIIINCLKKPLQKRVSYIITAKGDVMPVNLNHLEAKMYFTDKKLNKIYIKKSICSIRLKVGKNNRLIPGNFITEIFLWILRKKVKQFNKLSTKLIIFLQENIGNFLREFNLIHIRRILNNGFKCRFKRQKLTKVTNKSPPVLLFKYGKHSIKLDNRGRLLYNKKSPLKIIVDKLREYSIRLDNVCVHVKNDPKGNTCIRARAVETNGNCWLIKMDFLIHRGILEKIKLHVMRNRAKFFYFSLVRSE
jgi:hypothetical protein